MERRKNILMDVTPKAKPEPIVEEIPVEAKPKESEIFKAPQKPTESVDTVEEPEDDQVPLVEAPKKQKRECSPKMKEHLKRCRELAKEKKAKLKAEREAQKKPVNVPPTIPEEKQWMPQRQPAHNTEIDYDRIISGVSSRLEESNLEQNYHNELEARIRAEEEEKAKNKYGNYFLEATKKFKRQAYKGYGSNIIKGQVRGNSILNKSRAYNPQSNNPYDGCF